MLTLPLPLRRTTLREIDQARRACANTCATRRATVDFNDAANLQVHLDLRRAELQERLDIVETEVHVIRLGTVAIATNPFELFLDYGNQIKARSFAEQTFLIQLACGTDGYLPTEKAKRAATTAPLSPAAWSATSAASSWCARRLPTSTPCSADRLLSPAHIEDGDGAKDFAGASASFSPGAPL